jgi:hypothetical protein
MLEYAWHLIGMYNTQTSIPQSEQQTSSAQTSFEFKNRSTTRSSTVREDFESKVDNDNNHKRTDSYTATDYLHLRTNTAQISAERCKRAARTAHRLSWEKVPRPCQQELLGERY